MSIPEECTVLVVGGGPGGSYAASVLAREGISTVLLEAETFPRYHIGESLLPSTRAFFKFVGFLDNFEAHGFKHKNGASFTYNSKPAAYTDFLAFGGHAWNVIRSEADQLLFAHASSCGAHTFQSTKVTSLTFDPSTNKPTSATWTRPSDKTTGSIKFTYLIDASGRAGLVSTKYLKNRHFNPGLKNIASWGYFANAGVYGTGTPAAGAPFFPRLADGSGWAWFIPLHDGTTSVGLVMRQSSYTEKKNANSPPLSAESFFKTHLHSAPGIPPLLKSATLTSPIRSTTDWSYSATSYASPQIRIVGDAGCFIDPLFSSGVHLALKSALTAAASICAVLRGHCSEESAAAFHSAKVRECYTRFLLVVTSAYAQIEGRERDVLNEYREENFERAFAFFRPIIQGAVEVREEKLTPQEIAESVAFCMRVIEKAGGGVEGNGNGIREDEFGTVTCDQIKKAEMKKGLDVFAEGVNGMRVVLELGRLGLQLVGEGEEEVVAV